MRSQSFISGGKDFLQKFVQMLNSTFSKAFAKAFKARGACNAVLLAKEQFKDTLNGIVTHSSGNHGQAVAYACSKVKRLTFEVQNKSLDQKCYGLRTHT